MNTIRLNATTAADGTLSLLLPLGKPSTRFEVVVVLQPHSEHDQPISHVDRFAVMDQIREQLAATGRDFGDSTDDIREDRDR